VRQLRQDGIPKGSRAEKEKIDAILLAVGHSFWCMSSDTLSTTYEVTVTTVHEAADIVSVILYDLGAMGVMIEDPQDITEIMASGRNWDYIDEGLTNNGCDVVRVTGYFEPGYIETKLKTRLKTLRRDSVVEVGSLDVATVTVPANDWTVEWRKSYKPIVIKDIVIVPAWIEDYDKSFRPVFLDPGQAFGTGSHESTALCIELMQECSVMDKDVLDIGCGSGILGICAIALGAKSATLTDIDPKALEVARENALINKCQDKVIITEGDLNSEGQYDLVLANLTADILIRAKNKIIGALRVGGELVLGGIIDTRLDSVLEAYGNNCKIIHAGDWAALRYRKG